MKQLMQLAALALCMGCATAADYGVVVVAHGVARGNWNQSVEARLTNLRLPWPVEVAFLSSKDGNTLQAAFDRLQAAGVRRAVVAPLMVSSHSSHIDEIRYYISAGPKPEEHVEAAPVKTSIDIRMTGAIDYHPLLAEEFCKRARTWSKDGASETVLLVGHGPNEEDNNQKWLNNFERYSKDLKASCGFKAAHGFTLRDDAPAEVRDAATAALRQAVADAGKDGGRVLLLPVLIGSGGVMHHIDERLKGLQFDMVREGLIEGDALQQWLVITTSSAISDWSGRELSTLAHPSKAVTRD